MSCTVNLNEKLEGDPNGSPVLFHVFLVFYQLINLFLVIQEAYSWSFYGFGKFECLQQ